MCYPLKLRTGRSRDRISVWGENFHTCPNRPCAPPKLPYNGYCAFSGISASVGVLMAHTHLVPTLKKEFNDTCTPTLRLRGLFLGEL